MKRRTISALMMLIALIAQNAFAGNGVGNGGGAWVCRDEKGQLRWSKLVDLYEAQNQFGLTLAKLGGSVEGIVKKLEPKIETLYPGLSAGKFIDQLDDLASTPPQITYVPAALPVIDDSLYFVIPPPTLCPGGKISFEQVVNYQDDGNLLVQGELFASLSPVDQAALIFHEGIYAFFRAYDYEQNSVFTRRVVGLVFSTLSAEQVLDLMNGADAKWGNPSAGLYELSVEYLDVSGIFRPLPAASLTAFTSFAPLDDSSSPETSVDSSGRATLRLAAPTSSEKWIARQLCLDIDGAKYRVAIPAPGWSEDLSSEAADAQYECAEYTLSFATAQRPGQLKIICADPLKK